MKLRTLSLSLSLLLFALGSAAQTSSSLFWRRDSLQVSEISARDNSQYRKVGHHGPAVENSMMALRIYFNDTGAVDVYTKQHPGLELEKYRWYPSMSEIEAGAGCDEYRVGSTVGLGGIALWDGEKEVKLVLTKERRARVGKTRHGSFAEVVTCGVPYCGDTVDVSIRIDVRDGSRFAKVTATSLSGRKLRFLTGVNYHPGSTLNSGKGWMTVWGVHPPDVTQNPAPIGGGMRFRQSQFSVVETASDMLRIISRPRRKVSTFVIAASSKEDELNTPEKFEKRVSSRVR